MARPPWTAATIQVDEVGPDSVAQGVQLVHVAVRPAREPIEVEIGFVRVDVLTRLSPLAGFARGLHKARKTPARRTIRRRGRIPRDRPVPSHGLTTQKWQSS